MNARRLRVELAPSASLTIALLASHAVAAICAVAVVPGVPGALGAALIVALGGAAAWSRALLRARTSVTALELTDTVVEVELRSGERLRATVAERRYVGRYLVLLPLLAPLRRTVLITRDMTGAQAFRRLRIWALWGRVPGVAGKQLAA